MTIETANGHVNGVSLDEQASATDAKELPVRVAETTLNGSVTNANAITADRSQLYPQSKLSLIDRFIDEPRSLKVAVIGGGLAGILSGILFPAKVPNIQLTIYEKNHDFVSHAPFAPSHEIFCFPSLFGYYCLFFFCFFC